MEIEEFSHPDSIWTYKGAGRAQKVSVWLPYLHQIVKEKAPFTYTASYNGGQVTLDLRKVDCIMVYGNIGSLPVAFLDDLGRLRIPLLIHRRNLANPYCFVPARRSDEKDMLTRQVLCRENQIRRVYIARTLVRARILGFSPVLPRQTVALGKLQKARTIEEVRAIEAQSSKLYWKYFYAACGLGEVSRRDAAQPVNQALNACSVFFAGVLLRWTLLHRLAPTHGFLHEPSGYPALVYDLMEPVRQWMEEAVMAAVKRTTDGEKYTPYALRTLKDMMEEVVFVPATRQYVRKKSVLHGVVLALRAYLVGDMRRLVLPVAGGRVVGRPLRVSYKLPGGQKEVGG